MCLGVLPAALLGARSAEPEPVVPVAGQPLAANVRRVLDQLDFIGTPLPSNVVASVKTAADRADAGGLQRSLDAHVWFVVELNPESRVKVRRGSAPAIL